MQHNKFVLASGSEIHKAESTSDEIVSSKISKTDFEMYQQHFKSFVLPLLIVKIG